MNNSIQIVLVLYKTRLEDSLSYKTLKKSISILEVPNELLIWNNSSNIIISDSLEYIVVNSKENEMLSGAYNFALKHGKEKEHDWLLLLDQDTFLTEDFFVQLNLTLSKAIPDDVAAIIPRLFSNNRNQISPIKYFSKFGPFFFQRNINECITDKCLYAMNSASLLNIKALLFIGGFPSEFPLDYLDFCYFYRFYQKKYSFYILNTKITHNLSVDDYEKNMTKERYLSILSSEKRFVKQIGLLSVFILRIRYMLRFIKQMFYKEKRIYAKETFKNII